MQSKRDRRRSSQSQVPYSRDDAADDDISSFQQQSIQAPAERRAIRRKYRDFLQDLQQDQHELINPGSDALNERLRQADTLYKPVTMTREAALDSQALTIIANYGRRKAQALNTEFVKFQPVEFMEKLMSSLGGNNLTSEDNSRHISSEGWQHLGRRVQQLFKRSPSMHFMYGSFERGEVHLCRTWIRRLNDKDNSQDKATIPCQVEKPTDTGKNEATTEEVERILGVLRSYYEWQNNTPICYFRFVINPHSFGQTIENIFYASFLVRDGHARIFLDEDRLPVIEPLEKTGEKAAKGSRKSQQVVVSLSLQEWKELIKVFEIQTAMISTRPSIRQTHSNSEVCQVSSRQKENRE